MGLPSLRAGLVAERDQAENETTLFCEEMRIKDARMARIPPHQRPRYSPTDRMAILELRAARGWPLGETARAFLVDSNTIAAWTRRVDDNGPDALVQIAEPVNKFPDFVRRAVARLKTLCPQMGKKRIAQTLARAGLHLCANTVKNILKKPPTDPDPTADKAKAPVGAHGVRPTPRVVTAKRPNHVWHSDLTVVPIAFGFWVPWAPQAILQFWPFCWWILAVTDHFSRRVLRLQVFKNQPTSVEVRTAIGQTIETGGDTCRS